MITITFAQLFTLVLAAFGVGYIIRFYYSL